MVETTVVEKFLYKEARLLDENQYDDWLSLWTEDVTYWVPSNLEDYDPKKHISIIYDNRKRLEERIFRLKSGSAWSQTPPSRMIRVISNVECESTADEIDVYSNFILTELRRGETNTYPGRSHHKLILEDNQLKIRFKKVNLLHLNENLGNLTFLI